MEPAQPKSRNQTSTDSTAPADLHYDILILGGGFAGVYAAKTLGKALKGRHKQSIGLIAAENHMVFQPMLPEVAGSELSPMHVVNPIRLLCKGTDVLKGEVEEVSLNRKQVLLNAGAFTSSHSVSFNQLVVALGAVVDLRRIPGMVEHAYLMQNVGDAMKLRGTVIARMEEANLEPDRESRQRLLQFIVVGGGYSGVETAGQIIDLLNSIHKYYRNVDDGDFSVSLVHSRDHLLPTMISQLGQYTQEKLAERGVQVILNCRVASVTATKVTLDNGQELPASTVVSTVGNAAHPVVDQLCTDYSLPAVRGRIEVGLDCRVAGHDYLWAAGDCASMPMPGNPQETCPPTAQFAMRQGVLLGGNVAATYLGHKVRQFEFKGLGELAVIGHRTAVANVMGINFSGFLAWWMWRTIYLLKLPGLERKLRVMIDWTLDIFFPRDISLLSPRYTSPLQETHLAQGDILFNSGEPAFSFYIVKQGRIEIRDLDGNCIKAIEGGGHFGERALLDDGRWRFTAVATKPTILISVADKVFKAVVSAGGIFSRFFQQSAGMYQSNEEIDTMLGKIPETMRNRTAADIMQQQVAIVSRDMLVGDALTLFRNEPHSAYPVVDQQGKVLGALRRSEFYEWYKISCSDDQVNLNEVPLIQFPQVSPETSVGDIFERMVRAGSTKALVLDPDDKILGIIALVDLLGR